jgi:hypothetical protein
LVRPAGEAEDTAPVEISEADARSAPLDAADPFLSGETQGTEKVSDTAGPCLSFQQSAQRAVNHADL